jgi:hypothetical protein
MTAHPRAAGWRCGPGQLAVVALAFKRLPAGVIMKCRLEQGRGQGREGKGWNQEALEVGTRSTRGVGCQPTWAGFSE